MDLDDAADRAGAVLVTGDAGLADEVGRLAAAAGVSLQVAVDAGAVLARWPLAAVVLVGTDRAAALADLRPRRRRGVHVVGWAGQCDATYRSALSLGAEHVLELPAAAEILTDALADLGDPGSGEGRVLGVVGGSGGVGATTLACALGQQAGRSGPALVVDLDPWGPGADLMLGLDRTPGVRWPDLAGSVGRLSGRSLREAVPLRDGVGVLAGAAGGRAPDRRVVREALSAAVRGHRLVVLDLPRGLGDSGGVGGVGGAAGADSADGAAREATTRCDLVVLVVQPTPTGVAAAARVLEAAPDPDRLGAVVRVPRRTGVDPRRVADALGVPLLAALGDQRNLEESIGLGLGPTRSAGGALARACRQVLA